MDAHANEKRATVIERVAITPKEFGARFGKSVTWAYRQIYAGKIKILDGFHPRLIPISEIDRFLRRAVRYNGNRRRVSRNSGDLKTGRKRNREKRLK